MEIVKNIEPLKVWLAKYRAPQYKIGFVPTMGALHEGHISLVKRAKEENDRVVASIFVNPNQFNDKNDLVKYPRDLENDLIKLEKAGCHAAFIPEEKEMYPETDHRKFDFGLLDKVLEGAFREGHFTGVAQVVSRLFDIVGPQRAYFGEKDLQQLAIIKQLVKQLRYPIEIIGCPIIREPDGLAMSSRNLRLSHDERKSAAAISKILYKAREMRDKKSVLEIKKWVLEQINAEPLLRVEYFEVIDVETFKPISGWDEDNIKYGCIAVYAGNIRLIDNLRF